MNERMSHVERIVRPVHALQSRKLGMRQELLAHLEDALAEERRATAVGEHAASEAAKSRLGPLPQLTAELQDTVPATERLLLTSLKLPGPLQTLETKLARVPGKSGRMTLGHISLLSSLALLCTGPFFWAMFEILQTTDGQVEQPGFCLAGTLLGWYLLVQTSYALVFAAAGSGAARSRWSTFCGACRLLSLHLAMTFFCAFTIAARLPAQGEVLLIAGLAALVLTVASLAAWRVGSLRQPYDCWLNLS